MVSCCLFDDYKHSEVSKVFINAPAEGRRVPDLKPLIGTTKVALVKLLLNKESTVRELASALSINMSAVRKHLEDMKALGLIESRFEKPVMGRPKKLYSLSPDGREILFSTGAKVLRILAAIMKMDLGLGVTKRLFERAAREIASEVSKKGDVNSALKGLRELGFQSFQRDKNVIVSSNCPIFGLAKDQPGMVCDAFHSSLLKYSLGVEGAVLMQTMARGSKECIHTIRPPIELAAPGPKGFQ
jgi:predicted ArsR family transcriptional regulator